MMGRTHAVVVGLSEYELGEAWSAPSAALDAQKFVRWLISRGVPAANVLACLTDSAASALPEGVRVRGGSQAEIVDTIFRDLQPVTGDLLFVYWAGHGVESPVGGRRLYYADASAAHPRNLDVDALLHSLSSDLFAFPRQVWFIESCAHVEVGHRQIGTLPDSERFRFGTPRKNEQFVLYATRAGDRAAYARATKTGVFSEHLFEHLEALPPRPWPPDMTKVAQDVRSSIEGYRARGLVQVPATAWFRDWNGDEAIFQDGNLAGLPVVLRHDELAELLALVRGARLRLSDLVRLYDEVSVDPWKHGKRFGSQTCAAMIRMLADRVRNEAPPPVLEFALRLLQHLGNADRWAAVRKWCEATCARKQVSFESVMARTARTPKRHDLTLLVALHPVSGADDRVRAEFFRILAPPELDSWENADVERLSGVGGELPFAQLSERVNDAIDALLPLVPTAANGLTIEVFASLEQLTFPFDQLPRRRKIGRPRPFGSLYRLVVRSYERSYDESVRDELRCSWLARRTQNGAPRGWCPDRDPFSEAASFEVLLQLNGCSHVALPYVMARGGLEDLVSSGAPFAVWTRRSDARSQHLMRQLAANIAADWRDQVGEVRRAAEQRGTDHHGRHLVVLWDDPSRLPPDSGDSGRLIPWSVE